MEEETEIERENGQFDRIAKYKKEVRLHSVVPGFFVFEFVKRS